MIYEIHNDMNINNRNFSENDDVMAVSLVYPDTPLSVGISGSNVSIMQSYLNAIKNGIFPSMTRLTVDGNFGKQTKNTVIQYQGLKGLHQDGIIGEKTWNAIVTDYDSLPTTPAEQYPGTPLRTGASGTYVINMQTKLNNISPVYSAINYQVADGKYGTDMTNAVRRFQRQFGLNADGIIGPLTWNKITAVSRGVTDQNKTQVTSQFPGYVLNTGSQGDSVRFIQSYLNAVNSYLGVGWPVLTVDGIYGNMTKQVVRNFQTRYNLSADGIVGANTWAFIIRRFNNSL